MIRLVASVVLLASSAQLALAQGQGLTDREAEIYKATRSAIIAAKGRAASKDLSVRKAAVAGADRSAKMAMAGKFGVEVGEIEAIVRRGELADGTARKKADAAGKAAAKADALARNQEIHDQIGVALEQQWKDLNKPPAPARSIAGVMNARRILDRIDRGADPVTGKMPPVVRIVTVPPPPPPVTVLNRPGGAGNVHVAIDLDSSAKLKAALAANDLAAFRKLTGEGKVVVIPNGTRVRVVEAKADNRLVEVLEGPNAGMSGWVEFRFVDCRAI